MGENYEFYVNLSHIICCSYSSIPYIFQKQIKSLFPPDLQLVALYDAAKIAGDVMHNKILHIVQAHLLQWSTARTLLSCADMAIVHIISCGQFDQDRNVDGSKMVATTMRHYWNKAIDGQIYEYIRLKFDDLVSCRDPVIEFLNELSQEIIDDIVTEMFEVDFYNETLQCVKEFYVYSLSGLLKHVEQRNKAPLTKRLNEFIKIYSCERFFAPLIPMTDLLQFIPITCVDLLHIIEQYTLPSHQEVMSMIANASCM